MDCQWTRLTACHPRAPAVTVALMQSGGHLRSTPPAISAWPLESGLGTSVLASCGVLWVLVMCTRASITARRWCNATTSSRSGMAPALRWQQRSAPPGRLAAAWCHSASAHRGRVGAAASSGQGPGPARATRRVWHGPGLPSGRLCDGGSLRRAPRRAFQPAAAVTGPLAASAKARARGQPGPHWHRAHSAQQYSIKCCKGNHESAAPGAHRRGSAK